MRNLVLAICTILLLIAAYVLWSNWDLRHARTVGAQNLRQIGLALQNYHSAYKTFPPAHLNDHSWRIRCNPFLISSPLFMHYDFDSPWDSVDNLTIHRRPLRSGKGPDPDGLVICGVPYAYHADEPLADQTAFLMLVGDDAFSGRDHGRTMSEISDPLDCTIAVAETSQRDIHWLHPLDFDVDKLSFAINDGPASISSDDPLGPLVLFADGGVYRLNSTIDADTLRALITINGNEDVSRDRLLARGLLIEP